MNDPFSQMPRAEIEAKVTALVLGELPPDEAAALRTWMLGNVELTEWRERLERSLIRVREAVSTPGEPAGNAGMAVEPRRLSGPRRDQLLQKLRQGRSEKSNEDPVRAVERVIPVEFKAEAPEPRRHSGVGSLALAAGLVALLGGAAFLFTMEDYLRRESILVTGLLGGEAMPSLSVDEAEDRNEVQNDATHSLQFQAFDGGLTASKARVRVTNHAPLEYKVRLEDGKNLGLGQVAKEGPPPPAALASSEGRSQAATPETWAFRSRGREAAEVSTPVLGDKPMLGKAFDVPIEGRARGVELSRQPARPSTSEAEVLRRRLSETTPLSTTVAGVPVTAGAAVESAQASGGLGGGGGGGASAGRAMASRFATDALAIQESKDLKKVESINSAPAALPALKAKADQLGRDVLTERLAETSLGNGVVEDQVGERFGKTVGLGYLAGGIAGAVPPPPPSSRPEPELRQKLKTDAAPAERGYALAVVDSGVVNAPGSPTAGYFFELAQEKSVVPVTVLAERDESAGRPVLQAPKPVPVPQAEVQTAVDAFSTFSLNVADVSFKLADASLANGSLPDSSTIRSEEFLNAFDYRDPQPVAGAPLAFAWERARDPFTHGRDLLRLAVKTASVGRDAGTPLNLVLVLDNSGSMERADRVRILRECLRVLSEKLGPADRISVVAFARTARLWVDALPGDRAGELLDRVGQLTPEGGTNLEDALRAAYETALKQYLQNGGNRVILLTDGAANLGEVRTDVLRRMVAQHRAKGVALDCFGIGWEGYNDEVLEALSRNGDGRYGFVNSPEEASDGFAAQLAGALQVAASDVKVQVEFNPRRVASWRQVGYAKHQLTQEQFRDNTVDAAEIGAAESGNALYVIDTLPGGSGPVATVRVRFREPASGMYREHSWEVPYTGLALPLEQSRPALRLAAVASLFAESLAESPYAAEATSDRLLGLMAGVPAAFAPDPRPGRLEWMIRQAKSLRGR